MDTIGRLKNIFSDFFGQPLEDFGNATSPEQIEDWDSAEHVRLVLKIEQEFNVEFTPRELASLTDVGAIREILERRLTI